MLAPFLACIGSSVIDRTPPSAPVTSLALEPVIVRASGTLVCRLAGEPHELHRAAAVDGVYALHGLLADSTYSCNVGLGEPFEVTTEPLPDWVPRPVVGGDPGSSEVGYLLAQTFWQDDEDRVGQPALVILDREGRVRWYHALGEDYEAVDASYLGDGRVLYGGNGGPVREVDLYGEPIWESWQGIHHDVEELPSGLVAGLIEAPQPDYMAFGVVVFDPNTGEETWRWESQDHLDTLPLPAEHSIYDVWHANSLQIEEVDGVVESAWINVRNRDLILRIDRDSGDVDLSIDPREWSIQKAGGEDAEWFHQPHDVQVRGHEILLYDNGWVGGYSRIMEFEFDEDSRVATGTFQWGESWYESVWGGVDELGGGHLIVARGHCTGCPTKGTGGSQLIEVDRSAHEDVWRVRFEEEGVGLYRVRPIDGCSIFSTSRYCD